MDLKNSLFQSWTILVFYVLFSVVTCEFSGFYVDNGIGQTVMEERLDETELLRHHMLDLFDLPYGDDQDQVSPSNR